MKQRVALSTLSLLAATALPCAARRGPEHTRLANDAPAVSDVAYEITFNAALARARMVHIAMSFTVSAAGEVGLSLPAWTPGAYEISNFARNVTAFAANAADKPLRWDKLDFDTWRVWPTAAGRVRVSFDFMADSLDNAMAWTRPDFLLLNGTNVFLYPEGGTFEFPATVTVRTETGWHIATSMHAQGANTFHEANYHDLVDMPWFIGNFDLDSMQVDGHWSRLATYPAGALEGAARDEFRGQIAKMTPAQAAVFGETPWDVYSTMIIFDPSYGGGSALEHQSSHVGVYNPGFIGNLVLPLITAHEQFHAWNVKRLRPADMWPYHYSAPQPTPWLWVSEGITDYYADLTMVRSGVAPEPAFYAVTSSKIGSVDQTPAVALEDASLNAWIHPRDGTDAIYYAKGSLAGLLLDIQIRDGSDNRHSLDDVLRELYRSDYRNGRGFTGDDWWSAVARAAGGRSFADFYSRYVDGREPFPWAETLPLAGMMLVADSAWQPRIGVQIAEDSSGVRVNAVTPGSMAEKAGVQPGDYLISIGDIVVKDVSFGDAYRRRYDSAQEGTVLPIMVRRDGGALTLNGPLHLELQVERHVEPDPSAGAKAARIRAGIIHGHTNGAR